MSSGSPTYPLDVFAALTPDHKYLNVAVVNATEKEQKFDISVAGAHLAGPPSNLATHRQQPGCRKSRWSAAHRSEIKEIPIERYHGEDSGRANQRERLQVSSAAINGKSSLKTLI